MNVLALDCGSSSLKFRIFARDPVVLPAGRRRLARGLVERIGDDNSRARLAVEVFRHRPRKYSACTWRFQVGADAVVFSGGIGEHAPEVRARICAGMQNAAWPGGQRNLPRSGARLA